MDRLIGRYTTRRQNLLAKRIKLVSEFEHECGVIDAELKDIDEIL